MFFTSHKLQVSVLNQQEQSWHIIYNDPPMKWSFWNNGGEIANFPSSHPLPRQAMGQNTPSLVPEKWKNKSLIFLFFCFTGQSTLLRSCWYDQVLTYSHCSWSGLDLLSTETVPNFHQKLTTSLLTPVEVVERWFELSISTAGLMTPRLAVRSSGDHAKEPS